MTDESEESAVQEDDVETEDEPVEKSVETEADTDEVEEEPAEETAEAEDDESDETPEAEDELAGIQPGDVLRLAYTAFAKESGMLVDTTDPEVAEEEGVDDENQTFEPRVVVVGEGHLFETVEQAIIGSEPGDDGSVVVPAAEAFGEEDPDLVETVSANKIPEDDRYPGAHVDIDGRHGFVERVIGGRARVDFNHPLAGEDIEYDYEILELIDDRIELAQGLLSTYLDVDLDVWMQTDEVSVDPDDEDEDETVEEVESLYIEATPALAMNQQWLFQKQEIAGQLIEQLDIDRVVVQEILESRDKVLEETQSLLAEQGLEDVDMDELIEE